MKLATLHDLIKAALRRGEITIGIAETFAAVPADRQASLWEEMGGHHL